jgi:hypothetical protein
VLLFLLGYVEGLHDTHEAVSCLVTALCTLLRTAAAAGWQGDQGKASFIIGFATTLRSSAKEMGPSLHASAGPSTHVYVTTVDSDKRDFGHSGLAELSARNRKQGTRVCSCMRVLILLHHVALCPLG